MKGERYHFSPLKRSLDLAIVTGAIPATSPIWLAMYCYNRSRQQPLLFQQKRLGKDGETFQVLKFETLTSGAELSPIQKVVIGNRGVVREKVDPRIPSESMMLMRETGLNELPQLINVLRGEMSMVGPRPLFASFLNEAEELFPNLVGEWKETALRLKPGVVGVSPLKTRRLPPSEFEQLAKEDIRYYYGASFWTDIAIIAEAMIAIARRT